MVRLLVNAAAGGLLKTYVQAADLLDEKLARPRGTLVPCENPTDPARPIQLVDDERLAPGADDSIIGIPLVVDMGQGSFNRQRLGDIRQGQEFFEPPTGNGDGIGAGKPRLGQYFTDHPLRVSLVGP